MEIVSNLEDLAFLLSDNPDMIGRIPPQRIIHAVLPDTAGRSKIMPRGSSHADMWMVKHGNPLSSVDSAVALAKQALGDRFNGYRLDYLAELKESAQCSLHAKDFRGVNVTYFETSETLPGAILLALLNCLGSDGISIK